VLGRHELVVAEESADGRERPWRALVTGFGVSEDLRDPASPHAADTAALLAVQVQREHRLLREYLARRDGVDERWRSADTFATYTLRLTPDELNDLGERLDGLIRPYIGATREDAPDGADLVHLTVYAFPREQPR
jgi:hypothetical protein